MENNGNSFQYTYCAKEQAEVEKIRNQYLPVEEDKMGQLRRLDRKPGQKAQTFALTLGIMGALLLGTGMSMIMTEFGSFLGDAAIYVGIALGVLGLIPVALAYPCYNRVLQKERQRIAPEILRLTDELMQ